jgi:bacillithiol synthase
MFQNALREYDSVSADQSPPTAAGTATRLAVDVRRFPWVRPLVADYASNFDQVAPFYAGNPQSADAWRERAARVQAHRRDREAIAHALLAQQDRRSAPPESRVAAERLLDPSTVAVVTGQQAGAFGGPFFTILKAISAIQLARRAERSYGIPAIAIFWVDAEDHDWDEVASCVVLDGQLQPHTTTLPAPDGAGELPVAQLRLDERAQASIDELEAALAETDFRGWVIEALRASYRPGVGMADAFARWMEWLLGPFGLVVFDASDASVKPLVSDVFTRELSVPCQTAALAAKAGEGLQARGHSPQVVPQPDSVSLFRINGGRTSIRRHEDHFDIGEAKHDPSSLVAEAAAHPERFSPNVLLRPIVQDTLFPTICYVAGPSELAYLGQLRGVYEHFGLPMPLIHPRASATLVDSAAARFLTKYDVPLEDLQPQDESALNRLLQSQLPPTVDASLKEAEAVIESALKRVMDVVPAVDATLVGAAKTTLGKMEHELKALQGKVISAAKKRDETMRRQFTRAQSQTFPTGHPQERVLAGIYFLNLYGPALVTKLFEELPLEFGQHWVLTI